MSREVVKSGGRARRGSYTLFVNRYTDVCKELFVSVNIHSYRI